MPGLSMWEACDRSGDPERTELDERSCLVSFGNEIGFHLGLR